MRKTILLCLTLCAVAAAARPVAADPTAFLRTPDDSSYYIAVKADPPLSGGRDQAGNPVAVDVTREVIAAVYQEGRRVASKVEPPDGPGVDFIIRIPADVVKGDFAPLLVSVHSYPTGQGQTGGFSASVATEVGANLTVNNGNCIEGFPVEVSLNSDATASDYVTRRFARLLEYMRVNNPSARIHSHTEEDPVPWPLKSGFVSAGNPEKDQRFVPCLRLAKDPPSGTFDIAFNYPSDAPVELRHLFLRTDVVNASHSTTPFSVDGGDVGTRAIEQNLDLGVQYGSEVSNTTETNDAGVEVPVRRRDSKGTLDLRFAPLLNALRVPDPGSTTFKFFTPFMLDARVSTGKINEDTLSLNRIVLGSEFEIRHYTNPSTFPTFQRYIFSFRNASDRDFKQAEWKANFEFQPVFSALNRPLRFRRKSFESKLDPDPNRGTEDIPVTIGFGQQFLPVFGAEVGRTWRDKSPFAAIEQSDFVRRFYFGGTLNLDLTAYVRVSVKDILYVRGESKDDRLHNYFLGTVEVPFPAFNRNAASSAFFSFERGGQPPFSTPDVNALKLGYRVQWDGWFGKRR